MDTFSYEQAAKCVASRQALVAVRPEDTGYPMAVLGYYSDESCLYTICGASFIVPVSGFAYAPKDGWSVFDLSGSPVRNAQEGPGVL